MAKLPLTAYENLVRMALAEDIGSGDATTNAIIPTEATGTARMVAREELLVCGLDIAAYVFRSLDPKLSVQEFAQDGELVGSGQPLLSIQGSSRALLTAERTALNFVQKLSGIATLARTFCNLIADLPTRLLDTRKTTPGWRTLEKYAVACGGGTNHRIGLHDMILIKDNHIVTLEGSLPNPIHKAVKLARQHHPNLKIEVETDTLEQVQQAVEAGADIVLLDNMPPNQIKKAVGIVNGRCKTEASGGIKLNSIRSIAECGVDFISIGALTHSSPSVDIGLDFDLTAPPKQRPL